jgi:transposase-like protein
MKTPSGSKGRTDLCTEPWIPQQTIDFLLTAKRDAAAAKRSFRKTLLDPANPPPRVINVDKNRAYPAGVEELKVEGALRHRCRLRQCKYLGNVLEQDRERPEFR